MAPRPPSSLEYPEAELVFGLVGPVGTDLARFQDGLISLVRPHGYDPVPIRLSNLIKATRKVEDVFTSEHSRIKRLMDEGTGLRQDSGRGDIVAMLAVQHIFQKRSGWSFDELSRPAEGDTLASEGTATYICLPPRRPAPNRAYVINSLKHPDEVGLLRRIYGTGFYLIGVYVPEDERFTHLTKRLGMSDEDARDLMDRDDFEGEPLGQKTRDVFHRADVFVRFRSDENTNRELERFVDLVFGDPFKTPTVAEHSMFLAFANSLRSASLSRQVGAVLVSAAGEVVGVGANDVPCRGGGLYWPGEDDQRDHILGYDSNDSKRDDMLLSIMESLSTWLGSQSHHDDPQGQFTATKEHPFSGLGKPELLTLARDIFKRTSLGDITEFGRAVHAEMEAILSCARGGANPRGATLYCTTFPCHNCAKHIVAVGLERVIYVEPYPKSQASVLHPDAIAFDAYDPGKVNFQPFVGIGPRRYFDLFSMTLGSGYDVVRKDGGLRLDWGRDRRDDTSSEVSSKRVHKKGPRVPMLPSSYIDREQLVATDIEDILKVLDLTKRKEAKHGTDNGHA